MTINRRKIKVSALRAGIIIALSVLFPASALRAKCIANDQPDLATLEIIRKDFYWAIEDNNAAERLHGFIEKVFGDDMNRYPVNVLAYTGALEAVMAKHTYNPYSKVKHVIKGLKILDQACLRDASSLEVRFLRFSVLHNLPAFFGYRKELDLDLKTVYELLKKQDYSYIGYGLQRGIAEFLIESRRLTEHQSSVLTGIFPDIKIKK